MNFLVFGDSHTEVFKYSNNRQNIFKFHVCEVPGATAQGVVNPNSKTDALKIFTETLFKVDIKNYSKFMIMLGEVDCGFVIWVRSQKYNISVDSQINLCIKNLKDFLENIVELKFDKKDIIILGSILPTIKDNTDKKFLNGARKDVKATLKQRIEKTIEYNNKLKELSKDLGYHYIDITDDIYKDGSVNSNYLNKDPYNHHLDNEKSYLLWLNKLICFNN